MFFSDAYNKVVSGYEDIKSKPYTSHIKEKHLDLFYADTSAHKLDLYLPNCGEGPFPVILALPGGGCLFCDKKDWQLIPVLKALDWGYAVASICYRLSSEAIFPAQLMDVKAAIRFLRAQAQNYKLDASKFVVWGQSAGATLASLVGTTEGIAEFEDLSMGHSDQSSAVQAVVDWFGPIYFLKIDTQLVANGFDPFYDVADSAASLFLGGPLQEVPERAAKLIASDYATINTPPFLIVHGTQDKMVPLQQSQQFAEELCVKMGPEKVNYVEIEGGRHGGSKFVTEENLAKVLEFLNRYLRVD